MSDDTEDQWLFRLANLNVDRDHGDGKGVAPHKPLLLLAVIEMIGDRHLEEPNLEFTAELVYRFLNFWPIVEPRRKNHGDMRLPFHALGPQRDRVWSATLTADGKISNSRDTTKQIVINDELWKCLQSPTFRQQAKSVLVATYFTPLEQVALSEACGIPIPHGIDVSALKKRAADYEESLNAGRCAHFRRSIVVGYYFQCALTGYSFTTTSGLHLVEAAHIRPLKKGGPNVPENGLALTPNSHWLLDKGMWTVDEQLRIVVASSNHFKELGSSPEFYLQSRHGQPLILDRRSMTVPAETYLAYHRKHIFVG